MGELGASISIGEDGSLITDVNSWLTVDRDRRLITISNQHDRGLFVDLYRTVRQIFLSELLSAGFVCIHGSAVVVGNTALVLTGPKGAGKTTTSAALATRGAKLLANDKVLLGREQGSEQVIALHLPEAPGVTLETILMFPRNCAQFELARRLGPNPKDWFEDHPELPNWGSLNRRRKREKLYFSETQWATFLGVRICNSAPLGSVLRLTDLAAPAQLIESDLDDLVAFPDWLSLGRGESVPERISVTNFSRLHVQPDQVADLIMNNWPGATPTRPASRPTHVNL